MDFQILLGIVWISVCGLLRFGEGARFTGKKYDNKPQYAIENGQFTFEWRYSSAGTSLELGRWKKKIPGTPNNKWDIIAKKSGSGSMQISDNYVKQVRILDGSRMEISKLKYPDDQRLYEIDLQFVNFEHLSDQAPLIIVVPPKITRKTDPLLVEAETNTILQCAASGNPRPKIKWTMKDVNGNTQVLQSAIDNHYGYNITNAGRKDKGLYTCEAIVLGGEYDLRTSYQVQINVKYKPVVEFISPNQSRTENSQVSIECRAVGDPAVTQYHWYKNSPERRFLLNNGGNYKIWGDLGRKLTIKELTRGVSDWYYCAAENSVGIGNGTGTYVTALYAPTDVQIVFTPPTAVNDTKPVTLKCVSDGVPSPSMQWQFKGRPLDPAKQVLHGTRSEEVKISSMERELTGNYSCEARNVYGTKRTSNILHMNFKPENPQFSTGIEDLGVVLDSSSRLTCKADGYPPPKFTIKKFDLSNNKIWERVQEFVKFSRVTFDDEKFKYTCTPFNLLGSGPETSKVRITVLVSPSFSTSLDPSPITREENKTKNYTCVVDAKPYAEIKWYINGENVTVDKPYLGRVGAISMPSNIQHRMKTESTLALDPITWRHDGTIVCNASNSAGFITSSTTLIVKHRPVVKNAKDLPNNKTVNNNQDAVFDCPAIGNPSTSSYKWYFKDKLLPDETSKTLTLRKVGADDVGVYSCVGINSLGEGPPFGVKLLIKTPAKVTNHPKVTANVTGSATLFCEASGIPEPIIRWYRGNNKILHVGDKYYLTNLTFDDRGLYQCEAVNELDKDKADVELVIQVKPNITSNKPTDTQRAGVIGNDTDLRCDVLAIPRGQVWFTRESDSTPLTVRSARVKSINERESGKTLRIQVKNIGEIYYCHARNLLGYARQKYTIRKQGPPDAPVDLRLYTIQVKNKRTVDVNVTWVPGYSGGFTQHFTILYKLLDEEGFTEVVLDNAVGNNHYVLKEVKPLTVYVFKVRTRNIRGLGGSSREVRYTTGASDIPPARGKLTIARVEGGTSFLITWTMNKNVTSTFIQYREVETAYRARRSTSYTYGRWMNVEGAQGLSQNTTSFMVVNLDAEKTYQFRMLFKTANEFGVNQKMIVESEIIQPLVKPEKRTGLKQDELIAIIAACAGVLLILIVVLCLCCFKRRKKHYGDGSVQMSQTGSAPNLMMSYGDTADTRLTNRRSYATESVEDDPFIHAHIASEKKKKRRPTENGVNHGYASQGTRGMSQSVGQLERSSYSSLGPQRDFATLPPEPPSFEEAIRQSVKKSKQAMSTGDLTGAEPRGPYGRSRARTPDSDTSDSEVPLSKRPMFKVRPLDPATDKRYKSAPSLPPLASPVRVKPRDPSTMYARPRKGPPPSYTPEDRDVIPGMADDYEPRVTRRRPTADDVLELQENPSYRRNDRLPDLPPSMPEFSSGRGTLKKEPLGETLPEPPSFLRDLSDDEPDGRHPRSNTEPRNRPKKPYVNIHGQLVRPSSPTRQPAYGSDRQEPIYANDPPRLVAPEPEVPTNQRRNRHPSAGEEQHKPGYVSSGFLV